MRKRLLTVMLALALLFACAAGESAGTEMSLLAINVRKADALLLRSGESAYLIDTGSEESTGALLDALRACAARDANRTKVVGITALGLVELTRKKARQSLGRQLLHTCPHCGGDGVVFAHETTARRAIRELWRRRRGGDATPMLLMAAPEVCGWMKTIGAPEGGATWALPTEGLEAGEYRLSPVDPAALPAGCKLLKRG